MAHRFRAGAFPIGIDTGLIAQQASGGGEQAGGARPAQEPGSRGSWPSAWTGWTIRKGLPERFHGFERYLQRHPEQQGLLTYLQIAPVSRGEVSEYQLLRNELEQIAGHINGNHAAARLDAAALRQPQLRARHADRLLSHGPDRPGHAAARRHEPGRQGIRRRAGSGRSRRAGAVDLAGAARRNEGSADRQSATTWTAWPTPSPPRPACRLPNAWKAGAR